MEMRERNIAASYLQQQDYCNTFGRNEHHLTHDHPDRRLRRTVEERAAVFAEIHYHHYLT